MFDLRALTNVHPLTCLKSKPKTNNIFKFIYFAFDLTLVTSVGAPKLKGTEHQVSPWYACGVEKTQSKAKVPKAYWHGIKQINPIEKKKVN